MKNLIALLLFVTIFVGCQTRGIELEFERANRLLYDGYIWDVVQLNDSIFVCIPADTQVQPIFFKNSTVIENINTAPIINAKKIKDTEIKIEK